MPEIHLKQHAALGKPQLTYIACRPFTKNKKKKEFENLKKQEIQNIFTEMS